MGRYAPFLIFAVLAAVAFAVYLRLFKNKPLPFVESVQAGAPSTAGIVKNQPLTDSHYYGVGGVKGPGGGVPDSVNPATGGFI